jgi:hypothetical protein
MFDAVDEDPLRRVVDPIENAKFTDPDAIAVRVCQLKAAWWARVLRQGMDLL